MIRKLRFRFIAVSMAALFAALVLTMGLVSFLVRSRVRIQYEAVLEAILDSGGVLPVAADGGGRASLKEWPELPYEARFFTDVLTATTSWTKGTPRCFASVRPPEPVIAGETCRSPSSSYASRISLAAVVWISAKCRW